MKKLICVLLAVLLCLCGAACDNINYDDQEQQLHVGVITSESDSAYTEENVSKDSDEDILLFAEDHVDRFVQELLQYDYELHEVGYMAAEDTGLSEVDGIDGIKDVYYAALIGGMDTFGEEIDLVGVLCVEFSDHNAAKKAYNLILSTFDGEGYRFERYSCEEGAKAQGTSGAYVDLAFYYNKNLITVIECDWDNYEDMGMPYHDIPMTILDEITFE